MNFNINTFDVNTFIIEYNFFFLYLSTMASNVSPTLKKLVEL